MTRNMREGPVPGFEIPKATEEESIASLKARVQELESQVVLQNHWIRAMTHGFTYIRDQAGRYYRLYNNGLAASEDESFLHIDWDRLTTTLRDGEVVAFCRTMNGCLKEWTRDESGPLIALN